jgi:hypothetical protein
MKKILFSLAMLSLLAISSCKTNKDVAPLINKSTSSIKVPAGFTWQNSRNLNFKVNLTDTKFQYAIASIAIYDANPATGGHLLAKGSATVKTAFNSKVYLSNQTKLVYIVKTAPDNTKTTITQPVGTSDVVASIGR